MTKCLKVTIRRKMKDGTEGMCSYQNADRDRAFFDARERLLNFGWMGAEEAPNNVSSWTMEFEEVESLEPVDKLGKFRQRNSILQESPIKQEEAIYNQIPIDSPEAGEKFLIINGETKKIEVITKEEIKSRGIRALMVEVFYKCKCGREYGREKPTAKACPWCGEDWQKNPPTKNEKPFKGE
jgi:hypothetical protein